PFALLRIAFTYTANRHGAITVIEEQRQPTPRRALHHATGIVVLHDPVSFALGGGSYAIRDRVRIPNSLHSLLHQSGRKVFGPGTHEAFRPSRQNFEASLYLRFRVTVRRHRHEPFLGRDTEGVKLLRACRRHQLI